MIMDLFSKEYRHKIMILLLYPSILENAKLLCKKPHGNKGIPQSKEAIEKNRQKHLGKKHTKESKEKTRNANFKNKNALGKRHTSEQNEINRQRHLGLKQSKDAREKNSKSQKEYNKLHPERIEKLKQSHYHMFSALDHLLKDKYCILWTEELRESVRIRDGHICQLCGIVQTNRNHDVHHIHYDKPNCYPDLVCLCNRCNVKANTNRNYYESLFMNKLNERNLLFWTRRRKNILE